MIQHVLGTSTLRGRGPYIALYWRLAPSIYGALQFKCSNINGIALTNPSATDEDTAAASGLRA
jgi:hypothetical protein